jgi:hypothetical protein
MLARQDRPSVSSLEPPQNVEYIPRQYVWGRRF